MTAFSRLDSSLLGRWWWTVDRWTITALIVLAAAGAILTLAASPPVAERLNLDTFYFARRQLLVLPAAISLMLVVSLLNRDGIRRLALSIFAVSIVLTLLTLVIGAEIKGATRWIQLWGYSVQPSEFVKPAFAVIAAWMFTAWRLKEKFAGFFLAIGLYASVVALLLAQPDVGMTVLVSVVWGIQFFLAGLPMVLVMGIGVLFIVGGFIAYFQFDHVQARIDRFFDPAGAEAYQVARSLEAFQNGGIFGRGPGEGRVKEALPDAHADFIFAVAGEEFGMFASLIIVALYGLLADIAERYSVYYGAILPALQWPVERSD